MLCKDCRNYINCHLLFGTKQEKTADDCDEYVKKDCAGCFDFPEDCKNCKEQ